MKKNNLIIHNADDILLLCVNMEQMFDHFIYEVDALTEIERLELISLFENTYVEEIIKQVNDDKRKKKTKRVKKVVKIEKE